MEKEEIKKAAQNALQTVVKKSMKQLCKDLALQQVKIIEIYLPVMIKRCSQKDRADLKKDMEELKRYISEI